jgi:hypothetical protein
MRRVRGEIDWYYTENMRPAEAVEKAWELREKHEELKKVEPRKKLVHTVYSHFALSCKANPNPNH